ncbi:hypothetical protein GmHk_20G056934 [Glycine max]|nr:hypothetical protein GmHk_20G056934 [Glycine max]
MDRSWMQASCISDEYENEVEQFLQFIELNVSSLRGKYFCPCVKCANGRHQPISEIRSHLICHKIIPTYTKWIWHGELPEKSPSVAHTKSVDFVWDGSKFGIPNIESTLFLTYVDVNEITTVDKWLNIVILQLWTMYMDEWSNSLGHGSLYGFLEPQSIHNAKDRHGQCEEYIGKWLKEFQRQVAHWQLIVLCPTNNLVVWFCSMRKRPDVHIKTAINKLSNIFEVALKTTDDCKLPQSTPQWIEVKSHVERGGYECGYYVMHWMWNIIGAELKTDWSLWFGDATPLETKMMTTLRQKWAEYFFKLRNSQCTKQ